MTCLKHYYSLGTLITGTLMYFKWYMNTKSISILCGRNVDSEKKEESRIYIYRWTECDGKR